MVDAVLGTRSGVYLLRGGSTTHLGLESERISAVYVVENPSGQIRILAGSYENGLFLSEDTGDSWREVTKGFGANCVRWLGDDPLNPGHLLAGTEPARVYRSSDSGETWQELDGIRKIEGHEGWYLPYSPRAGAVRNVYTPPGSNLYLASVEVGGLLESTDNGTSWTCRHVTVDSDIHYITGHPNNGEVLFAALGYASIERTSNEHGPDRRGGVARSIDRGKSWKKLFTDYTRGVIVPPTRTDLVISGPSPDVGRNGRIEVSRDGGDSWEFASEGLETPMPDMVEVFLSAPSGDIWAICSGGRLLTTDPDELVWHRVAATGRELEVESVAFLG